jgi:hypothetical protein
VRPYLEKKPFIKKDWWSGSRFNPWVQILVLQKKVKIQIKKDSCLNIPGERQHQLTCIELLLSIFIYYLLAYIIAQNNGFHYIFIVACSLLWLYSLPLLSSLPPTTSFFYFHVFVSRFCMWEKLYDTCLSESGLFYLTWWSLFVYVFLQTT